MPERHDVFLSYASRDQPQVERLAHALGDHGVAVWLDKWDLAAGRPWQPQLADAVDAAPVVVVCLGSRGGDLGPWQSNEVELAIDRAARDPSRRVIPVWLPGCADAAQPSGFLGRFHGIDLRPDPDARLRELVALIRPAGVPASRRSTPPACPYRGLEPFGEEHAKWMFGREAEVEGLLAHLEAGKRLLVLAGPSGAGKSSLVRAGLIRAVRTGALDGRFDWRVAWLRPREEPLSQLALALLGAGGRDERERLALRTDPDAKARYEVAFAAHPDALEDAADLLLHDLPGDPRLLVVVDQFEEIFTQARHDDDDGKRRVDSFVANLLRATQGEEGRVHVVLALRADFLPRCLEKPELAQRLQEAVRFALPPMRREQIEDAIRRPAISVGADVERAVVDSLADDVAGRPGSLPLLQHALDKLWELRDRTTDTIRWSALTDPPPKGLGGLEHAIARSAQAVLDAMKSDVDRAAARAIFGRLVHPGEGTIDTRRRTTLAELGCSPETARALAAFVDARIITIDDQGVEIVHEALLEEWPTLRQWIDSDRARLQFRQELGRAAKAWAHRKESLDDLWRGTKLARALEDLGGGAIRLSDEERAFLDESEALRKQEADRTAAERDLRLAEAKAAERLGRRFGQVAGSGLVLAVVAIVYIDRLRSRERAALLEGAARAALQADDPTAAWRILADPDQERGWSWTALAAQAVRQPAALRVFRGHEKTVDRAVLNRGGTLVLTASRDRTARLWRVDGTVELRTLCGHSDTVHSAAFSPDGTRVVTASADGTARVWSVEGPGEPVVLLGHGGEVRSAVFSPDGSRVLTGSSDNTARIWRSDGTGEPVVLKGHEDWVVSAVFSPRGFHVLTGSRDKTARIWRSDGVGEPVVLKGHEDRVVSVAFDGDGDEDFTRVLTASNDRTACVWSPDGTRLAVLRGHGDSILTAVFSPDGSHVLTASADRTARVWRSDGTGDPVVLHGHEAGVQSAVFSPDGYYVLTASADKTARVWRSDGSSSPVVFRGHQDSVLCATFSRDGSRVLTASADATAQLWRTEGTGQPAVSQGDGDRVPPGKADGVPDDVTSGERLLRWHQDPAVSSISAPDGSRVLRAYADGTARVWRVGGPGEPVVLRGHEKSVLSADFDADGSRVVTASEDSSVRVWHADGTGRPLILRGHTGPVLSVVFSSDGDRVLTASEDGTARIWRADGTGQPIVLHGHGGHVFSAAFASDGSHVLTASGDGWARVWGVTPDALLPVLDTAEPRLSPEQRARYLSETSDEALKAYVESVARVRGADGK